MGAKTKRGLHSEKKVGIFTVNLKFIAKIVEDLSSLYFQVFKVHGKN